MRLAGNLATTMVAANRRCVREGARRSARSSLGGAPELSTQVSWLAVPVVDQNQWFG